LHLATSVRGGVAGAQEGGEFGQWSDTDALGSLADTDQRRSQIAVDVVGQGFQGRDVEDPATVLASRHRLVEEAVDRPEESCERLARTSRSVDQRVLTGGDRLPAAGLGGCRGRKARLEPGPRCG